MRIARLSGLLVAVMAAGLLLAPGAAGEPPFRLPGYITDNAGALTGPDRAEVESAVDRLYDDRQLRLWVVYVESFSGQGAVNWTQTTMRTSDLGSYDALLAVAITDRAYALQVPSAVSGISSSDVDQLRRNDVEPALRRGDWAGAAVAAADGLSDASAPGGGVPWVTVLIALAVIAVAVLGLVVWARWRRSKRRAAELAAARRVDPTDPHALATVPLDALDDLSKSMVVEVDNAVRTSANELEFAIEEFGTEQTEPFSRAVEGAKQTLTQAFNVRQQLDDAIPETPAQRRDLLTRVIVSAANADRELDEQKQAFEKLRDLVINAPTRLDGLTQRLVALTARVDPSKKKMDELRNEFAPAALTSVAGNIDDAKERLAFADHNINRARQLAAGPEPGQQLELVECLRATESAFGQARSLLDGIDSAAVDIRQASATLQDAIDDIQAGINQATALLQQDEVPKGADLRTARDTAAAAVDAAQKTGSTDPLGAFTELTTADADLDRLLLVVEEKQETAERLGRTLDEALFAARARVRAVSDYIDTHRGSIGPDARTRLAEANRHLSAADAKRTSDAAEAIAHANGAARLATQAQTMADTDVQNAQRAHRRHGGGGDGNMGAMIGGILIGGVLGGAMRGGLGGAMRGGFGGGLSGGGGGFHPGSFGGSGGGDFGGGGRF